MNNIEYLKLIENIKNLKKVAIAFSGGSDSALLMYVTKKALDKNTMAFIADTGVMARKDLKNAKKFLEDMKVKYQIVKINILENEMVVKNDKDRCYYCKKAIFSALQSKAKENGFLLLAEGTNADDCFDYRPGARALLELGILSPLKEAGLNKSDIREISRIEGLSTWDLPSNSCLATRIDTSIELNKQDLERTEKAEKYLMSKGFKQVRVRMHNNLARIEVTPKEREKFFNIELLDEIEQYLKELGYKYVAIDAGGYKTGKMNN